MTATVPNAQGMRNINLQRRAPSPGAGPLPSLYLGPVATRTGLYPVNLSATPKQAMLWSPHQAMDDITALQIREGNFRVRTGLLGEEGPGAVLLVQAEVEYPAGVFTSVTWGGLSQGTVPNNGMLLSDACSVVIPRGAWFGVSRYIQCTAGLVFRGIPTGGATYGGLGADIMNFGASGVTNTIGTNTRPTQVSAQGNMIYPASILGMTRRPTIGLIGDSRAVGDVTTVGTTVFDANGNSGEFRAIMDDFAVVNGSIYGSRLNDFIVSRTNQAANLAECSHIAIQRGINDIGAASYTAAQTATARNTVAGYFPTKPKIYTTLPPAGSADNITPSAYNATRAAYNVLQLALAPTSLVADINAVFENGSIGSGIWNVGQSTDWTHENVTGYATLAANSLWTAIVAGITR